MNAQDDTAVDQASTAPLAGSMISRSSGGSPVAAPAGSHRRLEAVPEPGSTPEPGSSSTSNSMHSNVTAGGALPGTWDVQTWSHCWQSYCCRTALHALTLPACCQQHNQHASIYWYLSTRLLNSSTTSFHASACQPPGLHTHQPCCCPAPNAAASSPVPGPSSAQAELQDSEDISSSMPRSAAPLTSLIWHASDTAVKPIVGNRRIERLPEPRFEARDLPFQPLTLTEMLNTSQRDLETFLTDIYRCAATVLDPCAAALAWPSRLQASSCAGWRKRCSTGWRLCLCKKCIRACDVCTAVVGRVLPYHMPYHLLPACPRPAPVRRAIASAAPIKDKTNVLCYFETLCGDTNAANILINSSLTILFIRMLKNAKAGPLRVKLASVLGEQQAWSGARCLLPEQGCLAVVS